MHSEKNQNAEHSQWQSLDFQSEFRGVRVSTHDLVSTVFISPDVQNDAPLSRISEPRS